MSIGAFVSAPLQKAWLRDDIGYCRFPVTIMYEFAYGEGCPSVKFGPAHSPESHSLSRGFDGQNLTLALNPGEGPFAPNIAVERGG